MFRKSILRLTGPLFAALLAVMSLALPVGVQAEGASTSPGTSSGATSGPIGNKDTMIDGGHEPADDNNGCIDAELFTSKMLSGMCYDNNGIPSIGIRTSLWEPHRIIELQRQPGCSSVRM